jgi:galactosamine-6-phosphate isomerase
VRLHIAKDEEGLSAQAAAHLLREIRRRPALLLGLATGASPTRTYARLAGVAGAEPSRFARVRILKLDEWLGLPANHPASSEAYLRANVLRPWGIPRSRYQGPRSRPADPAAECARLARWLRGHGPIDVCVLGLGRNGHLLMNEPADALVPGPHVARLAPSTRRHSMLAGLRRPPARGLTMGMADILRSRTILLLVSGRHKTAPLRRMIQRRVTSRCPASLLWLHPDVTVYCDRAAAGDAARSRK